MSHKFWRVLWLLVLLLVAVTGGARLSQAQSELPMGRADLSGQAHPLGVASPQGHARPVERNSATVSDAQAPDFGYWMSEGFEGNWPGDYAVTGWNVAEYSSNDGGEYFFGKRDCNPLPGGAFAGWSVGGGANGSQLGCNGNYPNNLNTWAFYGPVTLTGASAARLNFFITGKSEWQADCLYDSLWVGVSTDGVFDDELGWLICEDYSSGYWQLNYDLNNYLGRQIWLGFQMYSDASNRATGYTLDNISLDDCRVPGVPGLLAPQHGSSTTDTTPTFLWAASTAATGYRLLVDNNGDFSSPEISADVNTPQYTPGAALAPGTYNWAVMSYNGAAGCNAYNWSAPASFTVTSSPTCYQLNLDRSGQGSVPTPAPAASSGCANGRYIAGQAITLTAVPANGWRVASWAGTNNNSSTANTNTITMPASNHTATVNYVQQQTGNRRAVMPFILYGLTGFLSPLEIEPNNSPAEANGPILLNRNYQGYPNDRDDYFYFDLPTAKNVDITLTDITGKDPQLHLRDANNNLVGDIDATPPYSLSRPNLAAGRYYVRVVVVANNNSSVLYTLRVNAP